MCDRRARRRTKIRRLAYRLGLAENQCTGNLTVASDFLVPIAVKRGSKFVGSCAAGADIRFPEMLAPDQSVALSLIVNKVASISRIAAPSAGQKQYSVKDSYQNANSKVEARHLPVFKLVLIHYLFN